MDALQLTKDLIAFESPSYLTNVPVTDFVEAQLQQLGFATERTTYVDHRGVNKANIVGKLGEGTGGVGFFGHTDVVPADDWSLSHGPYEPTVVGDRLYGRGSCDMKGPVAAAMTAASRINVEDLRAPLYFTCTADEEVGYAGALQLVEQSTLYREMVDAQTPAIIGEPTRLQVVYAHKGGCVIRATSRGASAHSSTREGLNANLAMIPFLAEMKEIHDLTESDPAWHNNEFDPPTQSWNIGVNDDTKAINIKPPRSVCTVYFRPMPNQDIEPLLERTREAATRCGVEVEIDPFGQPVYVDPQSDFVQQVLKLTENIAPRTVSYGTDGGAFTALKQMVVFGPGDIAQAHTCDEWIELEQLQRGTDAFEKLFRHWCC